MLFPAYVLSCFKNILIPLVVCLVLTLFIAPTSVSAQQETATNALLSPTSIPKNDPSTLPRDNRTFIQSMMAEVVASTHCQLVGIDPIDPKSPCLGVNTQTRTLGYGPAATDEPQIGGILGMSVNFIGTLYTPTTSSVGYIQYLSNNFGIVKKAEAQTQPANRDGFAALNPIQGMWTVSRNLAYFFLILAFIFIGVGIMLRIRIDPRTVMSIQNQIPRIVMAILLITFSYAIGALLIDTMWAVTYVGINAITSEYNPDIVRCGNTASTVKLSELSTYAILETPFIYVNDIFNRVCVPNLNLQGSTAMGIPSLAVMVGGSMAAMLDGMVKAVFSNSTSEFDSCISASVPFINMGACISGLIQGIGTMLMSLVVFIALLYTLFRVWWGLLKAYIYILIYIITAPFWIVAGILPQKPLGFEKWLRALAPNLFVFPVTAWLIIWARELQDKFNQAGADQTSAYNYFVPPLVGNPFSLGAPLQGELIAPSFGTIIAFGVIIILPSIPERLRTVFKSPDIKSPGAIAGALGVGAAVVRAPAAKTWGALNRRNSTTNAAEAPISRMFDKGRASLFKNIADSPARIPFKAALGRVGQRIENRSAYGRGGEEVYTGRIQKELIQSRKSGEKNLGATRDRLRNEAATHNMSLADYVAAREQARAQTKRNPEKNFEETLRENLARGAQAAGAANRGGQEARRGTQGGTNQQGQQGQQDQQETFAKIDTLTVGELIVAGNKQPDLTSEAVRNKTPMQHFEDILAPNQDASVHKQTMLEVLGDWVRKPFKELDEEPALKDERLASLDRFITKVTRPPQS